jgi:Raf kinase inhibitor-like YbhB/YbcL family protein
MAQQRVSSIEEKMPMKNIQRVLISAMALSAVALAQAPAGGRGAAPPARAVFSVSTDAFPDGGEVPMHNAGRGENKSPAFEFHWTMGGSATAAPDTLQSYAVVFHDIENSSNKTTVDTLHWTAYNIPGTAKGLPEGLGAGDLADGTKNGPGINMARSGTGSYFGPGAGPGPFHHYIFEFYALDAKLDLPAKATRDDLMKAMDGHVIGKAAWAGRFHAQP